MNIPFVDLQSQYQSIKAEADAAVLAVMQRGDFVLGGAVVEFERAFAEYCGAKYCVGVDSGYSALELIVRAYGIGPGDEVITAANTFIATTLAISNTGATPVLVDCNEQGAIDVDLTRHAVEDQLAKGRNVTAIVPVDLLGHVVDHAGLSAIADEFGLRILSDAAESLGALHGGRPAAAYGELAARIRALVHEHLWDAEARFFKTLCNAEGAQRRVEGAPVYQPGELVDVRELLYRLNQRPSVAVYADEVWLRLGSGLDVADEGDVAATTLTELAEEADGLKLCVDSEGGALMPCGRCRQLLWENGGAACQVMSPDGPMPMTAVLPLAFGPEDIERITGGDRG